MKVLQQPLQLATDLYLIYYEYPHHDSGNVYAVVTRKGKATLIDCGSEASFPRTQKALRQIGIPLGQVEKVIATHGDADHVQGFHGLMKRNSKANLYIHRNDREPVINGDSVLTKSYLYNCTHKALPAERCIPLVGNQPIIVGEHEGMYFHTPGHSKGSGCVLVEIDGEGWLFAGDTVNGALIDCSLVGGNTCVEYFAEWQSSLKLLSQLDFDWVLTGHDPYPISRVEFERKLTRFGQMLNPWFYLDEDQDEPGSLSLPSWPHTKHSFEKAVAD